MRMSNPTHGDADGQSDRRRRQTPTELSRVMSWLSSDSFSDSLVDSLSDSLVITGIVDFQRNDFVRN